MSILDNIYNQAKPIQASGQQWMTRTDEPAGMGRAIAPPVEDPFKAGPPVGGEPQLLLPQPPAVQPGEWLKQLHADLHQRLTRGYELLEQPGLTEQTASTYWSRLEQLAWQITLLQAVTREMVPCSPEICACRLGGKRACDPSNDHRERYIQDLKRIHAGGRMAIPLTTPGGCKYTLVPWKSTPPTAGELDPLDVAALARVGAIAGCDELTLLDRIATQEVTTTT